MSTIHILLADDDIDDCLLFQDALNELPLSTELTTVNNGEQLMRALAAKDRLPDLLFLDLNMPRKNGLECLLELQADERFRKVPVIIFTTSFNLEVINLLHSKGARYYVRKPEEFGNLKAVILKGLQSIKKTETVGLNQFVLNP
jgi:CheY-like chemotaxis protein